MKHALRSLRPPARLALAVLALSAGAAMGQERSPFEPAGTATAPPPAAASPLDRFELRGVMTIGTETFVTLLDTSNSKSVTLALGETVEGVKATDFRPDENSVRVEGSGQAKRLTLREAKIVALAVPPPTPPPVPGMPTPPQVAAGQPPVAGPSMSDEEARTRMQRVAEEIRRRREMRRQMLEQQRANTGQPNN